MWIFVTIAILLVVGGGFAFRKSRAEGKATQVSFEAVQRRDVVQLVSATGRIQPETEVKISAEVSGEILELPVKEGQPVSRGDLLVRINPDIYLRQVEQQEASVKSAEARVLENRALSRQRELDARDAERLHRDGVRSEADLRASQAAFEAAAAGVLAAEADVLRAKAALNQARENLSKTTILAPMDGTVSVLNTEVGDRVVATGQFAGTEILRLADLKRMEVRVNVNENDVINVEVGDTSRISVDAYRRRQFTGIVREIATTAKTSGTGTQDEVTNFEVRIAIGNEDGALRPGMSASADIETKSVTAALTVPIQSVTVRTRDARKTPEEILKEREREDSRNKGEGAAQAVNAQEQRRREREDRESYERVVFIRDGSVVRLRPVETGIADTTHMEILSGVSEGEEVVAGPFSAINRTLKDGAEVRQAKPEGKSGASK
jgi:HlyD family secretion protein